jgi:hypothetical protein
MTNRINFIRNELERLGYAFQEQRFATEDGGTLWVVFCKQDKRLLCVEGSTQREAWDLALDLKDQIPNNNTEKLSVILPFRQTSRKITRKSARIAHQNDFKP